ncbi:MAG: formyltetrahydrofolate deformylase [Leptospiraceae bacterium]|nr:formyltetrahydrofolate deformylase [Leptospiraceae bacterium]MCB1202490.1 formyltetrahydrofolate deformylase [Leptospiraceae bacterium]
MKHPLKSIVLLLHCDDQPGIVSAISREIFTATGNILQLDQHTTDRSEGQFFMRVHFEVNAQGYEKFAESWPMTAQKYNARWQLYDMSIPLKMVILVSKIDHCLFDLLYRYSSGEFNVEIPMVISNHEDLRPMVEKYSVPFHFIPVNADNKREAESQIMQLAGQNSDFLVLARYMQILTPEFIEKYPGEIINIHHSFLPSFKGAYPYQRAYERGVKLIGATAHFVTEDLDEGPIIEQMVTRVSHRDNANDMKIKGKNLEKLALASAVKCTLERRIIRYGNRTVVFT